MILELYCKKCHKRIQVHMEKSQCEKLELFRVNNCRNKVDKLNTNLSYGYINFYKTNLCYKCYMKRKRGKLI